MRLDWHSHYSVTGGVEGDLGTQLRFVFFSCSVLNVLISKEQVFSLAGTPHQLLGTHPESQSPSLAISGGKVNITFFSSLSAILYHNQVTEFPQVLNFLLSNEIASSVLGSTGPTAWTLITDYLIKHRDDFYALLQGSIESIVSCFFIGANCAIAHQIQESTQSPQSRFSPYYLLQYTLLNPFNTPRYLLQ